MLERLPAAEHAEYQFKSQMKQPPTTRQELWVAVLQSERGLAKCMEKGNKAWQGKKQTARM